MGSAAWKMSVVEKGEEIRKGPWTLEEDSKLISCVRQNGAARWSSLAKLAGLKRDGKSCRMRWLNYLRPDLKHGTITPQEESLIIELHNKWGNKWSRIAENIPGRTDNEIKNHWRSHIKKMSPELIRSCNWPPTSENKAQMEAVREDNEPSSSKGFEDPQMATMKEYYAESDAAKTLNQLSCDASELHDGYRDFFTCEEINKEFIDKSSDMGTVSGTVAETYAASIVQHNAIRSSSSVTDSPMTVLSDSEEFSWDYNYIALWNLDHDVPSMHK
ncbi:hypothetical protein SUGI_0037030 [Cryptomeria japonica]|uniref:MYB-like transcription factor EOBII n=1 Tax=Cryptomeria japonica TaxID=3369 RepID=UPI002408D76B|nr:MYB-like transcription factor EOBII [Cryptomeria japonica]GLJ06353.1 hypothetical protein SUGI_0037030 [Cryptomeria japonica]